MIVVDIPKMYYDDIYCYSRDLTENFTFPVNILIGYGECDLPTSAVTCGDQTPIKCTEIIIGTLGEPKTIHTTLTIQELEVKLQNPRKL